MKKTAIICIFAGAIACSDEQTHNLCSDTSTTVFEPCIEESPGTGEACVITDALLVLNSGTPLRRYVYHHNGTHYDRIHEYGAHEGVFKDTPDAVVNFEWDEQGRVVSVVSTYPELPDRSLIHTYEYEAPEVHVHSRLVIDGEDDWTQDWRQFYVPAPKDSIYFFDGEPIEGQDNRFLFEFEDGNRIRIAHADADGPCSLYGTRWQFTGKAHYDALPNALKNYAVRYPFTGANSIPGFNDQFWIQESANNFVAFEELNGDGAQPYVYCWTYLVTPGGERQLTQFQAPEATLHYTYDCE